MAVRLADRLAAEEGPRVPAETQALLRWLADNHFTFLGYREYDLTGGPDGMALHAVAGTGLGILRDDRHTAAPRAGPYAAQTRDPRRTNTHIGRHTTTASQRQCRPPAITQCGEQRRMDLCPPWIKLVLTIPRRSRARK